MENSGFNKPIYFLLMLFVIANPGCGRLTSAGSLGADSNALDPFPFAQTLGIIPNYDPRTNSMVGPIDGKWARTGTLCNVGSPISGPIVNTSYYIDADVGYMILNYNNTEKWLVLIPVNFSYYNPNRVSVSKGIGQILCYATAGATSGTPSSIGTTQSATGSSGVNLLPVSGSTTVSAPCTGFTPPTIPSFTATYSLMSGSILNLSSTSDVMCPNLGGSTSKFALDP